MERNLELTPTKGLTEEQWQELRRSFSQRGMVGGSDAGALLGLDGKYRSPITIYYDSIGINNRQVKMNEVMLHGKLLEGHVANLWQYWSGEGDEMVDNFGRGNKVRKCKEYKYIAQNPKYPHLFANVDRIITKHPTWGRTKGVLEIKTIRSSVSDMYALGFPPKYTVQCQHYMLVFGLPYAELAYLKDGSSINVVTFEADRHLQDMIVEASVQHANRVQSALSEMYRFADKYGFLTEEDALKIAIEFEPDADGLLATEEFFSDRHNKLGASLEIVGPEEMKNAAERYKLCDETIKEWEAAKMNYRTQIQQFMQKRGANSMKFDNGGYVNWRKIFKVKI